MPEPEKERVAERTDKAATESRPGGSGLVYARREAAEYYGVGPKGGSGVAKH